MGFNDLLNILLKTLKKDKNLRKLIRKKYPVAFIDEFQDTDIQQYNIFNMIYKNHNKTGLFLIGDPKQAIYSFRGADIFSYLYAKSKIKKHYYLDTNWRSSAEMCHSINLLFSQNKNPFIFNNIPYISTIPAINNLNMYFSIDNINQVPMRFFFHEECEISLEEYQYWIAKQCANTINYWLNCAKTGRAVIQIKNNKKILQPNDIAILVRNQTEANLIQKELKKLNIPTIYSSYKKSIFETIEAQELLCILESILEPENEKFLQKSISTYILKKLLSISTKKYQNKPSYFILEKLYEYHDIWKKKGIFHMVKTMILEYQKNSIDTNIKYKKNLNFLHIAELLEEQFQYFYKKKSLIRWFYKKILGTKQILNNEYIRYFHDSNTVKIITIHKSKGLEYPIVWIPFSINFNQSKISIYHNQKNFKIFFDPEDKDENLKKSDKERLAEDIRFLYVAITRSIVHCSIGIACLIKKKIKNRIHSDIHKSSLGYIIQNGQAMNYESLLNQLNKISINNLIEIRNFNNNLILSQNQKIIYLIPQPMISYKNIKNIWNITSFTKLNEENKLLIYNKKEIYLEKNLTKDTRNYKKLTVHNFPSGKKTGLLMHYILKNLSFLSTKKKDWFSKILEKYNIPVKWTSILISWVHNIINIPLYKNGIILSKIQKDAYITELEFFLSIKNCLESTELNKITQSIDPISMISPKIFFNPVTGMLKGFIDLVFVWKKKYYIIDYKSNWLGKNNNFYSDEHIKKEIIKRRYDLQYQIYTLFIHRYLQKKLKKYDYYSHFGGIFYIFLRALNDQKNNNGIFYTIPDYSLIKKINTLIS